MTPAEYAKAQGWRVGDLVSTATLHEPFVIDSISSAHVRGRLLHRQLGGVEYTWTETPFGYKRIGRVLRPEGR